MQSLNEKQLEKMWAEDPRWAGVTRTYTAKDVVRLRGSIPIEYSIARLGAERLWNLLHTEDYIPMLGGITGNQAIQQVQAGLKAVYMSGWQVAGDANLAGQMYPDQSLYPSNSVPALVRAINNALIRADQVHHSEGVEDGIRWLAPIVADAEAGFGGCLNAFELMKAMIEAGAGGVHFDDQLVSARTYDSARGSVLIPTEEFIRKLRAARLAADIYGVPTVLIARTGACTAKGVATDTDVDDLKFLNIQRTSEGYFGYNGSLEAAISRSLKCAPYVDMLWYETSEPNLNEAEAFSEAVHARFPGKLLAYNCSPSFRWNNKLDKTTIARFQRELAAMGYKLQFVTRAAFHALNFVTFELAHSYVKEGMMAYARFQDREFEFAEWANYSAVSHQRFVGTGYFDDIAQTLTKDQSRPVVATGGEAA